MMIMDNQANQNPALSTTTPPPVVTSSTQPQFTEAVAPTQILNQETMWTTFRHVLSYISLAFFAGSLLSLWNIIINHFFPSYDDLSYIYGGFDEFQLYYSISTLIVSAPLFIFLFYDTHKQTPQSFTSKHRSQITLTYITLIITFTILIVQTITAINSAMMGAFTLNFGLHLLATFLVNGIVFAYYLYEVKLNNNVYPQRKYLFGLAVLSVITIATLATAIIVSNQKNDVTEKKDVRPKQVESYQPPVTSSVEEIESLSFENSEPIPTANSFAQTPFITTEESTVLSRAINVPTQPEVLKGLSIIIQDAKVHIKSNQQILELSLVFEANDDCSSTETKTCGVNRLGFQSTDGEGFKLARTMMTDPEALTDWSLRSGEKARGKYFFAVDKLSSKYLITYNDTQGNFSPVIELRMQ